MKVLHVSGSNLDELRLSPERLEGLLEVDISRNNFRAVPSNLQYCDSLTHLNCSYNQISISEEPSLNEELEFFKPQKENKFELIHPEDSIYTEDDLLQSSSGKDSCSSAVNKKTFDFSKLSNLTVINLSHNDLVCLPDSFFLLSSLTSVDLSHNLITNLPPTFKSAQNLRQLNLSWNLIRESPQWLQCLVRCVRISLSGNPVGQMAFSEGFGNTCRRVRYLEMENTFIRGNFPPALTSLLDLRHLKLSNKKITMEQVRSSSNKRIYFDSEKRNSECPVKRNTLFSLPETFGNLIGLTKLEMVDVELDFLPESFGQLRSLKILDVSQNIIFWLPRTFISLSNLEFCNISRNRITILDLDFEKMRKLNHLIACFNQISEIPESLSRLHCLETLDLYSNEVMSVVPLSEFRNLKRLDLASNPVALSSLEEICYVEQYQSLQANIRSCSFDWDLFTKEEYSMEPSLFQNRIELPSEVQTETSLAKDSPDISFGSTESVEPQEVLSASSPGESEDHEDSWSDSSGRLQPAPAPLPGLRSSRIVTEGTITGSSRHRAADCHQFDDAD